MLLLFKFSLIYNHVDKQVLVYASDFQQSMPFKTDPILISKLPVILLSL